jgi:hypothetical protein
MTRADTLKEIADHHYALADLFTQLAGDSASASESAARPVAAASAHAAAPASTFSDGVPIEEPPGWLDEYAVAPEDVAVTRGRSTSEKEAVQSQCPVHFKPWTVKEGGISKNGKPYSAFWKCNGKNQDGSYCSKKPTPAWVKSHPPENALVAA